MKLEPKILHYVIMLANEKNFSKAAQQLYISQPSLSYKIIKLEKELGTQLFIRGRNEVQLTHTGKIFVERAKKIIEQIEQLKKEVREASEVYRGQLSIGSMATTGAYLLPMVIPEFQKMYPGIELVLIEDFTHNLEQLVVRGQVEISILTLPVENQELEIESILKDEILLAVPQSHPLAKQKEVDLETCKQESFISLKKGSGFRTETEKLCREAGFEPNIIFETVNIATCQSLVSSGMGISFVPKMVTRSEVSAFPPVYLPIKRAERPVRNVAFAYKDRKQLSKAARDFIDIMQSVVESRFL